MAATLNSEHTLVIMQHVARLAHAALLAVRAGFGADALAVAIGVRAGRMTRGKAVCELAVGRALQSYGVEGGGVSGESRGAP